MIIGIPKEIKDKEFRVAIVPAGVRTLTTSGHQVIIEKMPEWVAASVIKNTQKLALI